MVAQDYLNIHYQPTTSNPRDGPVINNDIPPLNSSHQRMEDLMKQSQNVVLSISAFPILDPFPDKLIVDENKVSIIYRHILGSESIDSVLIENISDVTVEVGIILATLKITNSSNVRFPIVMIVSNLRKGDAMRARRTIQGLIAAKKHGVNLSSFNVGEISLDLERLGQAKGVEQC